jgi:hypothetical protein
MEAVIESLINSPKMGRIDNMPRPVKKPMPKRKIIPVLPSGRFQKDFGLKESEEESLIIS